MFYPIPYPKLLKPNVLVLHFEFPQPECYMSQLPFVEDGIQGLLIKLYSFSSYLSDNNLQK